MTAASSPSSNSPIPSSLPAQKDPHWFFSNEDLDKTPSRRAGFDADKELFYRQQTASFIQEMGSKLSLTSTCVCTAIVYAHRFYYFHSFQRFSRNDIAATSLFLAAKVQECPRKLEYVVKVSYALQHREEAPLELTSNKYLDEAQKIITYENILLQTLGFEIDVDLPHSHVLKYVQLVKGLTAPKDLAQAAYFFATDILHVTSFCLRYRPSVVACVCIHLACNWAKWEIPEHEGKPWYYYVDPKVTKEIIEALSHEFTDICATSGERLKIKRYIGRRPLAPPCAASSEQSTSSGGAPSVDSARSSEHRPPSSASYPDAKHRTNDSSSSTAKREVKSDLSMSPSFKKPKTDVLDLNRYKERREKEKESANPTASSAATAAMIPNAQQCSDRQASSSTTTATPPPRKSFIPDVSKETPMLPFPPVSNASTSIYKSTAAKVEKGGDHHRHHSSTSEHRHHQPKPENRHDAVDNNRKRLQVPSVDAGPQAKIMKTDPGKDRNVKPDQHRVSQAGVDKNGRSKERPTSSDRHHQVRMPPLPKANEELSKAILNELSPPSSFSPSSSSKNGVSSVDRAALKNDVRLPSAAKSEASPSLKSSKMSSSDNNSEEEGEITDGGVSSPIVADKKNDFTDDVLKKAILSAQKIAQRSNNNAVVNGPSMVGLPPLPPGSPPPPLPPPPPPPPALPFS